MEKQSQSFSGLVSTAKDAFGVGMATAIAPLIPLIKDGLGTAISFTTELMPKLATGISGVIGFLQSGGGDSPFVAGLKSTWQSGQTLRRSSCRSAVS